jgi:hypothetical protein
VKQRTTWEPKFLRVTLVGVMLALIALGGARAAPIPVSKMAALGDGLTSAWDDGNKWERSWATGTETAVNSHRARLGGTAAAQNLAVAGSRWNSGSSQGRFRGLVAQARVVDADTQYVAILTGSADVCRPNAATFLRDGTTPRSEPNGIPRPVAYAGTIRLALQELRAKNADVKVLVASIPNWVQLTSAEFSAKPLMNLCPLLFGTGGVTADVSGFDQRLRDLNSAAQAVCAEFPGNCAYDNGAVYRIDFSPSDLTAFDNFHLTASGEAKISAATWPAASALLKSPKPTVRRVRAAPRRTVQARRAAAWVPLTAAVQARNATSMLVAVSRVGSKARMTLLRGSRVGSTRARRAVKSITIRPGTAPRQLILRLRKAAIVKGKRHVIVVTVRNAVGSQTIRIPVRG